MTTAELLDKIRERRQMTELPPPDKARQIRLDARLTMQDFAEVLSCSITAVHRWETGRTQPQGAMRDAYAHLLQIVSTELQTR